MSGALTPLAGRFAVSLFFFGTLSAGMSSIFPCLLIVPIMLSDYRSGELDTKSKQFKWVTGVASAVALTIPIFGANPVQGQIVTQVFNVFVLPIVVIGFIVLANRPTLGEHRNNLILNIILGLALIFSIVVSVNGVIGIMDILQ